MKKEEIYTSNDVLFSVMSKKYHDLHDIIDEFSARENLFNFKKKESLLRDLYLWVDSYIFAESGFNNMLSTLKFMMNNLPIRHNKNFNNPALRVIRKMDDFEKNSLYEKIFNLCLSCIFINEHYLMVKDEFELLKKGEQNEIEPYQDEIGRLLINPKEIAQDLCWKAWDILEPIKNANQVNELIEEALKYDKNCCDAYVLKSLICLNDTEKMKNLDLAIEGYEKSHDTNFFKNHIGSFHGPEFNPYTRALYYKAELLLKLKKQKEAKYFISLLLDLDKNDHIGARCLL